MGFEIIRNDITKVIADAIVNTANPQPVIGGGTDYAIYAAAGAEQLLKAREEIGDIARGEAAETPAFALNAKYIIHTVGPVWTDGEHGEPEVLRACYENSLKLAQKLKCRSVAFPLISTGVYGFPKDRALKIAMSVIQSYVMDHRMKVTLVVFDHEAFELCGSVFSNITAYINTGYVKKVQEEEYAARGGRSGFGGFAGRRLTRRQAAEELALGNLPAFMEADEEAGISSEQWGEPDTCGAPGAMPAETAAKAAAPIKAKPAAAKKAAKQSVNIDDLIAVQEKTFQEKLFEIIDARGLTGPEVYKNYISRQVYSKIQADKDYHPNKYTAIALCLSLHLDLEETKDLIGRAGWALSACKLPDLIVRACILNQEYNIVNINIILYNYNCPLLENIK